MSILLDALSHPARLQILLLLSKYKSCPVGNISKRVPISKSTVTQHIAKHKEAGFIVSNPSVIYQHYKLNEQRINDLEQLVYDFIYRISISSINKNISEIIIQLKHEVNLH